ncbi:TylF/MycF family methyltransferase [Pseudomonas sp. J452]|uniref:TylF/MycF family methyltransferase n=1 Tax=Pseudomonas sp. J452 TaxID=2898441 RepID=UPI0021AD94F4|nr:TylF/MycF family methyltransferase [Pseudomonas sp. J452]UUY07165.1 TylF/MycF family methyltransferase [Pseudomonas sp. J452]
MANYITDMFYGVGNKERFVDGVSNALNTLQADGIFAGDNLITWNRNMGFLRDDKFVAAINNNDPDSQEKSLVWRLHTLCWAARQCSRLEGDFVEAGVYKGFTVKVLCDYLGFNDMARDYYLYDVFYHTPDMKHHALSSHSDQLYTQVCERLRDYPRVKVVQGLVPDSFVKGMPEKIAFMHIDMNNADAEVAVLDQLYERLVPGGMIIFDDYGWLWYGAQQHAEDAWLSQRHYERILELPTGQGLLVKL